jgi:predicted permease
MDEGWKDGRMDGCQVVLMLPVWIVAWLVVSIKKCVMHAVVLCCIIVQCFFSTMC